MEINPSDVFTFHSKYLCETFFRKEIHTGKHKAFLEKLGSNDTEKKKHVMSEESYRTKTFKLWYLLYMEFNKVHSNRSWTPRIVSAFVRHLNRFQDKIFLFILWRRHLFSSMRTEFPPASSSHKLGAGRWRTGVGRAGPTAPSTLSRLS